MNRAVFLDRDGTLNVDKGYIHEIDEFEWLPGVLEALKLFRGNGYMLLIVTNQSGIARGYYSEADFQELNRWMLEYLEQRGIHIEKVYYCPHHPEASVTEYRQRCSCRKPQVGLFERAMREFNIDVDHSYVIGDKLRDCALCNKYACRGYLIGNQEPQTVIDSVKAGKYERIGYCQDLLACAEIICQDREGM